MGFDLLARCQAQREKHLYRQRLCITSPQGPLLQCAHKQLLAFCSNDYLGLANHPKLIEALQKGAAQWGVGGGASHLVVGHSEAHHQLELELAKLANRPKALLISTGYMANFAAITTLANKNGTVLQDRLNHASLIDAGLLSHAKQLRYRHSDMQSLKNRLTQAKGDTLIVTDGVFSMDGDRADLVSICQLAKSHDAWVMVDDAHGFGVLGNQGGGLIEQYQLTERDVQVVVGTLGKAFGTSGAFIAGSELLIESLIQFARPYIYTTSQSPALATATLESIRIAKEESWRRKHLALLVNMFREGAAALKLPLTESTTPIQPLLVGSSERAIALSQALQEQGILVTAIRPPTVPQGSARLRITLTAAHTQQHVEQLLMALTKCWKLIKR